LQQRIIEGLHGFEESRFAGRFGGLLTVPESAVGLTERGEGCGVCGLESPGMFQGFHCGRRIALAKKYLAESEVGPGEFGGEFQGAAIGNFGGLEISLLGQGIGQPEMGRNIAGVESQGLLEELNTGGQIGPLGGE
jgi:hypothetical protein